MISFVGAGPGDLELLTCKGQRRLAAADVVIYDRLVNPLLLFHCSPDCQLIYVGKQPYQKSITQSQINQLLITAHQNSQKIVRLKGGDPEIFGRLTEELTAVKQAGISFEIIPGITAASGAAAYNGIPLTERNTAGSVCFMTGYTKKEQVSRMRQLTSEQTMCLYMGVDSFQKTLPQLLQELPNTTPIAIIEWGTYGRQQKVTGTLFNITEKLTAAAIKNPAMIIIGAVVRQAEHFSWYERLPLAGSKLLLVASRAPLYSELTAYTDQGADIWWHQVGENRDVRFDEISERYLSEHSFQQIMFIDEQAEKTYLNI
jgi:uroporphyrin-III C-methyltransferase